MIEARPLTGFGWGRFQDDSLLYFRQSQNYPLTDVNQYGLHNFLLTYAVELGLPEQLLGARAVAGGGLGALDPRAARPAAVEERTARRRHDLRRGVEFGPARGVPRISRYGCWLASFTAGATRGLDRCYPGRRQAQCA